MNEYDKFDENEEQLDQFIKDSQREEKEKKRIESNILKDVKESTSQHGEVITYNINDLPEREKQKLQRQKVLKNPSVTKPFKYSSENVANMQEEVKQPAEQQTRKPIITESTSKKTDKTYTNLNIPSVKGGKKQSTTSIIDYAKSLTGSGESVEKAMENLRHLLNTGTIEEIEKVQKAIMGIKKSGKYTSVEEGLDKMMQTLMSVPKSIIGSLNVDVGKQFIKNETQTKKEENKGEEKKGKKSSEKNHIDDYKETSEYLESSQKIKELNKKIAERKKEIKNTRNNEKDVETAKKYLAELDSTEITELDKRREIKARAEKDLGEQKYKDFIESNIAKRQSDRTFKVKDPIIAEYEKQKAEEESKIDALNPNLKTVKKSVPQKTQTSIKNSISPDVTTKVISIPDEIDSNIDEEIKRRKYYKEASAISRYEEAKTRGEKKRVLKDAKRNMPEDEYIEFKNNLKKPISERTFEHDMVIPSRDELKPYATKLAEKNVPMIAGRQLYEWGDAYNQIHKEIEKLSSQENRSKQDEINLEALKKKESFILDTVSAGLHTDMVENKSFKIASKLGEYLHGRENSDFSKYDSEKQKEMHEKYIPFAQAVIDTNYEDMTSKYGKKTADSAYNLITSKDFEERQSMSTAERVSDDVVEDIKMPQSESQWIARNHGQIQMTENERLNNIAKRYLAKIDQDPNKKEVLLKDAKTELGEDNFKSLIEDNLNLPKEQRKFKDESLIKGDWKSLDEQDLSQIKKEALKGIAQSLAGLSGSELEGKTKGQQSDLIYLIVEQIRDIMSDKAGIKGEGHFSYSEDSYDIDSIKANIDRSKEDEFQNIENTKHEETEIREILGSILEMAETLIDQDTSLTDEEKESKLNTLKNMKERALNIQKALSDKAGVTIKKTEKHDSSQVGNRMAKLFTVSDTIERAIGQFASATGMSYKDAEDEFFDDKGGNVDTMPLVDYNDSLELQEILENNGFDYNGELAEASKKLSENEIARKYLEEHDNAENEEQKKDIKKRAKEELGEDVYKRLGMRYKWNTKPENRTFNEVDIEEIYSSNMMSFLSSLYDMKSSESVEIRGIADSFESLNTSYSIEELMGAGDFNTLYSMMNDEQRRAYDLFVNQTTPGAKSLNEKPIDGIKSMFSHKYSAPEQEEMDEMTPKQKNQQIYNDYLTSTFFGRSIVSADRYNLDESVFGDAEYSKTMQDTMDYYQNLLTLASTETRKDRYSNEEIMPGYLEHQKKLKEIDEKDIPKSEKDKLKTEEIEKWESFKNEYVGEERIEGYSEHKDNLARIDKKNISKSEKDKLKTEEIEKWKKTKEKFFKKYKAIIDYIHRAMEEQRTAEQEYAEYIKKVKEYEKETQEKIKDADKITQDGTQESGETTSKKTSEKTHSDNFVSNFEKTYDSGKSYSGIGIKVNGVTGFMSDHIKDYEKNPEGRQIMLDELSKTYESFSGEERALFLNELNRSSTDKNGLQLKKDFLKMQQGKDSGFNDFAKKAIESYQWDSNTFDWIPKNNGIADELNAEIDNSKKKQGQKAEETSGGSISVSQDNNVASTEKVSESVDDDPTGRNLMNPITDNPYLNAVMGSDRRITKDTSITGLGIGTLDEKTHQYSFIDEDGSTFNPHEIGTSYSVTQAAAIMSGNEFNPNEDYQVKEKIGQHIANGDWTSVKIKDEDGNVTDTEISSIAELESITGQNFRGVKKGLTETMRGNIVHKLMEIMDSKDYSSVEEAYNDDEFIDYAIGQDEQYKRIHGQDKSIIDDKVGLESAKTLHTLRGEFQKSTDLAKLSELSLGMKIGEGDNAKIISGTLDSFMGNILGDYKTTGKLDGNKMNLQLSQLAMLLKANKGAVSEQLGKDVDVDAIMSEIQGVIMHVAKDGLSANAVEYELLDTETLLSAFNKLTAYEDERKANPQAKIKDVIGSVFHARSNLSSATSKTNQDLLKNFDELNTATEYESFKSDNGFEVKERKQLEDGTIVETISRLDEETNKLLTIVTKFNKTTQQIVGHTEKEQVIEDSKKEPQIDKDLKKYEELKMKQAEFNARGNLSEADLVKKKGIDNEISVLKDNLTTSIDSMEWGQKVSYRGKMGMIDDQANELTNSLKLEQSTKKINDLLRERQKILSQIVSLQKDGPNLNEIDEKKYQELSQELMDIDEDISKEQKNYDETYEKLPLDEVRERFDTPEYYGQKISDEMTQQDTGASEDVKMAQRSVVLEEQKEQAVKDYLETYEKILKLKREEVALQAKVEKGGPLGTYNLEQLKAKQQEIEETESRLGTFDRSTGTLIQNGQSFQLGNKQTEQVGYKQSQVETEHREKSKKQQQELQKPGFFSGLMNNLKNEVNQYLGYGLANELVSSIRQAFSAIIQQTKELNKAMTDIQIVTGYNSEEVMSLINGYNTLARTMGVTTQEVMECANGFLRMGYSEDIVAGLTEETMKLSKLGMIDPSKAQEYLTSGLKGYKLDPSQAESLVDMATTLDRDYAVDTGYIFEALQRTAASASMAKVDMADLQAMISIIGETSQRDASVVGEGLKTAFARFGNVKASATDGMVLQDMEGSADEIEGVNEIEKVLQNVAGIKMREEDGTTWRSYTEVLDEIASKWSNFSDFQKNAITTATHGTRQREQGIIMFENYNRIKEASTKAKNSEGSSDEKMEIYKGGLEAAENRMKAAWEDFIQSCSKLTPILEKFYSVLTVIIDNFWSLAGIIGGIALAKNWDKALITVGKLGNTIGGPITRTIEDGKGLWQTYKDEKKKATENGEEFSFGKMLLNKGKEKAKGKWENVTEEIKKDADAKVEVASIKKGVNSMVDLLKSIDKKLGGDIDDSDNSDNEQTSDNTDKEAKPESSEKKKEAKPESSEKKKEVKPESSEKKKEVKPESSKYYIDQNGPKTTYRDKEDPHREIEKYETKDGHTIVKSSQKGINPETGEWSKEVKKTTIRREDGKTVIDTPDKHIESSVDSQGRKIVSTTDVQTGNIQTVTNDNGKISVENYDAETNTVSKGKLSRAKKNSDGEVIGTEYYDSKTKKWGEKSSWLDKYTGKKKSSPDSSEKIDTTKGLAEKADEITKKEIDELQNSADGIAKGTKKKVTESSETVGDAIKKGAEEVAPEVTAMISNSNKQAAKEYQQAVENASGDNPVGDIVEKSSDGDNPVGDIVENALEGDNPVDDIIEESLDGDNGKIKRKSSTKKLVSNADKIDDVVDVVDDVVPKKGGVKGLFSKGKNVFKSGSSGVKGLLSKGSSFLSKTGLGNTVASVGYGLGMSGGSDIGGVIGKKIGGEKGESVGKFIGSAGGLVAAGIGTAIAGPIGGVVAGGIVKIGGIVAKKMDEERQKRIKIAQEEKNAISEKLQNLESNKDKISRYDELAKGVNSSTGQNISLSDSEYEEFLTLSNELASSFPSMISYIDENGNAFLGLDKTIGNVTDSFEELIKATKKQEARAILKDDYQEGIKDTVDGYKANNKDVVQTKAMQNSDFASSFFTGNADAQDVSELQQAGKITKVRYTTQDSVDYDSDNKYNETVTLEEEAIVVNKKVWEDWAAKNPDKELGGIKVSEWASTYMQMASSFDSDFEFLDEEGNVVATRENKENTYVIPMSKLALPGETIDLGTDEKGNPIKYRMEYGGDIGLDNQDQKQDFINTFVSNESEMKQQAEQKAKEAEEQYKEYDYELTMKQKEYEQESRLAVVEIKGAIKEIYGDELSNSEGNKYLQGVINNSVYGIYGENATYDDYRNDIKELYMYAEDNQGLLNALSFSLDKDMGSMSFSEYDEKKEYSLDVVKNELTKNKGKKDSYIANIMRQSGLQVHDDKIIDTKNGVEFTWDEFIKGESKTNNIGKSFNLENYFLKGGAAPVKTEVISDLKVLLSKTDREENKEQKTEEEYETQANEILKNLDISTASKFSSLSLDEQQKIIKKVLKNDGNLTTDLSSEIKKYTENTTNDIRNNYINKLKKDLNVDNFSQEQLDKITEAINSGKDLSEVEIKGIGSLENVSQEAIDTCERMNNVAEKLGLLPSDLLTSMQNGFSHIKIDGSSIYGYKEWQNKVSSKDAVYTELLNGKIDVESIDSLDPTLIPRAASMDGDLKDNLIQILSNEVNTLGGKESAKSVAQTELTNSGEFTQGIVDNSGGTYRFGAVPITTMDSIMQQLTGDEKFSYGTKLDGFEPGQVGQEWITTQIDAMYNDWLKEEGNAGKSRDDFYTAAIIPYGTSEHKSGKVYKQQNGTWGWYDADKKGDIAHDILYTYALEYKKYGDGDKTGFFGKVDTGIGTTGDAFFENINKSRKEAAALAYRDISEQAHQLNEQAEDMKWQKASIERQKEELPGQIEAVQRQIDAIPRQRAALERQLAALPRQRAKIEREIEKIPRERAKIERSLAKNLRERAKLEREKEKIDAQERLNELTNFLERRNLLIEEYNNKISMYDWGSENLSENDFEGKLFIAQDKYDTLFSKNEELKKQWTELSQINPQTAEEARAVADQMKTISEQSIEASKSMLQVRKQMESIPYESLNATLDKNFDVFSRQKESVSKAQSIQQTNVTGINAFSYASINYGALNDNKSDIEKKREEYDELLKMAQEYNDSLTKIEQKYLDLKKEDDAEDIANRRDDWNDAYQDNLEQEIDLKEQLIDLVDKELDLKDQLLSLDDSEMDLHDQIANLANTELSLQHQLEELREMPAKYEDQLSDIQHSYTKACEDLALARANLNNEYGDIIKETLGEFNWVIDSNNWLADLANNLFKKWGLDSYVTDWNIDSNAKGTPNYKGGTSLVGDENLIQGSNEPSPELVIYPDGKTELVGQDGAEIRNLPSGTQILNTTQTEQLFKNIPSYANGTIPFVTFPKYNNFTTFNNNSPINTLNKLSTVSKVMESAFKQSFEDAFTNAINNIDVESILEDADVLGENGIITKIFTAINDEISKVVSGDSAESSIVKIDIGSLINIDNTKINEMGTSIATTIKDSLTKGLNSSIITDANGKEIKQDGIIDIFTKAFDVTTISTAISSQINLILDEVIKAWDELILLDNYKLCRINLDSSWGLDSNSTNSVFSSLLSQNTNLLDAMSSKIKSAIESAINYYEQTIITDTAYKLIKPNLLDDESAKKGWSKEGLIKDIDNQLKEVYKKINSDEYEYKLNAPTIDKEAWKKFGEEMAKYISEGINLVIGEEMTSNPPSFPANEGPGSFSSSSSYSYNGGVPIGAAIYLDSPSSPAEGHVGINGGDGYIYHAVNGRAVRNTLDELTQTGYRYRGWGWHGGTELSPEMGERVAEVAKNSSKYGVSVGPRQCQRWVGLVYSKATNSPYIASGGSAKIAGDKWIIGTDNSLLNQQNKPLIQYNKKNPIWNLFAQKMNFDNNLENPDPLQPGETIMIPEGLGISRTYMGWQQITDKSSNQYKLRQAAGMNFTEDGYGIINGRYVLALSQHMGNVGDYVDIQLQNGEIIHGIIGDIKNPNDKGMTIWGHDNGQTVVEFVVDYSTWYKNGKGIRSNPGNKNNRPEWGSKAISITRGQNYFNSYAEGTNYHPGGKALVGDEKLLQGSNEPSPELVIYPDGKTELVGQDGAEIRNLPSGTQVLNTTQTEQLFKNIPSYANGTEVSIKEGAKTDGMKPYVNMVIQYYRKNPEFEKSTEEDLRIMAQQFLSSHIFDNDLLKKLETMNEEGIDSIHGLSSLAIAEIYKMFVNTDQSLSNEERNELLEKTNKILKDIYGKEFIAIDGKISDNAKSEAMKPYVEKIKKELKTMSEYKDKTDAELTEYAQKWLTDNIFNGQDPYNLAIQLNSEGKKTIMGLDISDLKGISTEFMDTDPNLGLERRKELESRDWSKTWDSINLGDIEKKVLDIENKYNYKYTQIANTEYERRKHMDNILSKRSLETEKGHTNYLDKVHHDSTMSRVMDLDAIDSYVAEMRVKNDQYNEVKELYDEAIRTGASDSVKTSLVETLEKLSSEILETKGKISDWSAIQIDLIKATLSLTETIGDHKKSVLDSKYELGMIKEKNDENYYNQLINQSKIELMLAEENYQDIRSTYIREAIASGQTMQQAISYADSQQETMSALEKTYEIQKELKNYFLEKHNDKIKDIDRNLAKIEKKYPVDVFDSNLFQQDMKETEKLNIESYNEIVQYLKDHPELSEEEKKTKIDEGMTALNKIYTDNFSNISALKNLNDRRTNHDLQLVEMYENLGMSISKDNKIFDAITYDEDGEIISVDSDKIKYINDLYGSHLLPNNKENFWENQREIYYQKNTDINDTISRRMANLYDYAETMNLDEEATNNLIKNDSELISLSEEQLQNYQDIAQTYKDALDYKIADLDTEKELLDLKKSETFMSDTTIEEYFSELNSITEKKIAALKDYLKNAEYLSEEEYKATRKQIIELEKQVQYENILAELKEKQALYETQYNAMTYMVNEYTDALGDEKEAISDTYEDEIEKLEKINKSKERSIELTELQTALDNAKKEKKRIYRAGVGFVYEENREEIQKAEDDLDKFYEKDMLESMNKAKELELKYLDERIEGWNKYLDAIEKVYKTAERQHNIEILEGAFGVSGWDGVHDLLSLDLNNYLTNEESGVKIYEGQLTPFLKKYTDISSDIYDKMEETVNILSYLTSIVDFKLNDKPIYNYTPKNLGLTAINEEDVLNNLNEYAPEILSWKDFEPFVNDFTADSNLPLEEIHEKYGDKVNKDTLLRFSQEKRVYGQSLIQDHGFDTVMSWIENPLLNPTGLRIETLRQFIDYELSKQVKDPSNDMTIEKKDEIMNSIVGEKFNQKIIDSEIDWKFLKDNINTIVEIYQDYEKLTDFIKYDENGILSGVDYEGMKQFFDIMFNKDSFVFKYLKNIEPEKLKKMVQSSEFQDYVDIQQGAYKHIANTMSTEEMNNIINGRVENWTDYNISTISKVHKNPDIYRSLSYEDALKLESENLNDNMLLNLFYGTLIKGNNKYGINASVVGEYLVRKRQDSESEFIKKYAYQGGGLKEIIDNLLLTGKTSFEGFTIPDIIRMRNFVIDQKDWTEEKKNEEKNKDFGGYSANSPLGKHIYYGYNYANPEQSKKQIMLNEIAYGRDFIKEIESGSWDRDTYTADFMRQAAKEQEFQRLLKEDNILGLAIKMLKGENTGYNYLDLNDFKDARNKKIDELDIPETDKLVLKSNGDIVFEEKNIEKYQRDVLGLDLSLNQSTKDTYELIENLLEDYEQDIRDLLADGESGTSFGGSYKKGKIVNIVPELNELQSFVNNAIPEYVADLKKTTVNNTTNNNNILVNNANANGIETILNAVTNSPES